MPLQNLRTQLSLKFKAVAHRYRNYFIPADYRAYTKALEYLRDQRKVHRPDPEKTVCFEFTNPLADRESGRYAFSLIKEFVEGGYDVTITSGFWYLSSIERKPYKGMLFYEAVSLYEPSPEGKKSRLLISDRKNSKLRSQFQHVFHLNYYSRIRDEGPLFTFPYRPHPGFTAQPPSTPYPDYADDERPNSVSFFGHWQESFYNNLRKLGQFNVLTRWRMISHLQQVLPKESVHVVQGSDVNTPSGGLVLSQADQLPNMDAYSALLRKSNFFIACPGTAFPLSHNLIESMLLGCIPIIERPELTDMDLVPGKNCLSFDGLDGLEAVVRKCFGMAPEEIAQLRRGVREIAEDCLEPGTFARSLDLENLDNHDLSFYWFERTH
ncbi:MAG: hypothetical protein ACI8X5_000867 [Planctomycetota bacterium]|jgi:hypothetical protein